MKKSNADYKTILNVSSHIFLFAFLLNLFWESMHGAWRYECCQNLTARLFVLHILPAAFVDALIITGIYLGGIILFNNYVWFANLDKRKFLFVTVSTITTAFLIEYNAIYIAQKWSYTALMPTVFGIGLSPLVQLAATSWITIYFVNKIDCR
ncbi:hypothetical protein HYU06_02240 [Candidatus Woesearchaeota archaeon]|nr:hypothetical protein [Candidatus Woesearchaeota archaeon]